MRPSAVIFALSLLVGVTGAATSEAAPAMPVIAEGTPFSTARMRLEEAGFVPATVFDLKGRCGKRACRTDAILGCGGYRDSCRWLFVSRADSSLYFVEAGSGLVIPGRRYFGISLATLDVLQWQNIEVVLPNGVRRRFVPPPPKPPPPEPPTPLCSQVPPHTLPCWVKPPANYGRRG